MTSSSRAQLHLTSLHGTTVLKLGMPFSSGLAATTFMQDFTYNENMHCVVECSGKLKVYRCDQHQKGCKWEVRVTIRIKKDKSRYLFVSSIMDKHHDFCMSVAKPTARQLALLPTLRSAVLADRNIKRKALVALVQARDGVALQRSRSKLYRAKDEVLDGADGEWGASFRRLPFMLADLLQSNPGSSVRLEVDQHQRFLRGFVAFGANVACQEGLLPLLGFDGAHSRHSKYNGIVLSLLGRDGDNHNVTLATALVNVESEANVLWFLERSFAAGIDLSGRAVFCDRGKIVGAVKRFHASTGVKVNLRYCSVHLLRNMKKNFKLNGQAFENAVWAVQGATSHADYAEALAKILKAYGAPVTDYIKEIGPGVWTVHANMSVYLPREPTSFAQECEEAQNIEWTPDYRTVLPGDAAKPVVDENIASDDEYEECDCRHPDASNPLPLFNWRSSNFVESENNSMLSNGIRDSDPCNAFYKLAMSEMAKFTHRQNEIRKWRGEERVLTPYAKSLWDDEKKRAGEYSVEPSSDSVSYVSHPAAPTRSREVNLESLTCTCSTYDQMRIACRHLFVALRDRDQEQRCYDAFHPAYLVSTYANKFFDKRIALPVRDTPPGLVEVKPSPYYKQAGRRIKRRIASAGESRGKNTYVCRSCTEVGHNRRTCRRHGSESDELNSDLIASPFELPKIPTATSQQARAPVEQGSAVAQQAATRMSMAFLLDD